MNSNWKQVVIKLDNKIKNTVINLLQENEVQGIVIDKGDPSDSSIVTNEKLEKDQQTYIKAYFQNNNDCLTIMESIRKKLTKEYGEDIISNKFEYKISTLKEKDWSNSWQKFFSPTPVGDYFLVCPSWYDRPVTERKVIKIDPGQAFGVGTHESTRLAVDWLEKLLKNSKSNLSLLDVGTGTGILSIIAAYLGIKYIDAIDISKEAVEAAKNNISINRAKDKINVFQKDINDGLISNYNFVIANLLPDLIIKLLPSLISTLEKEGVLVLSGIILDREKDILKHIHGNNLIKIGRKIDGDWVAIAFRKG